MAQQEWSTTISEKYLLDKFIVNSWLEIESFNDFKVADTFFKDKENINIIKAQPLVKWVWWKRQIVAKLKEFFPKHFNNYFEPFLWWGAVFFNVQKKQSFLSDINEELINVYQVVKDNPVELIDELKTYIYEKSFFLKLRMMDREENFFQKYSKTQRAARFLFLNRTCFNWLYRVNSKGYFNVPFGQYKNPDFIQEKNIFNVHRLLHKTKAIIKLQSFEKVLLNAENGDFVYLDPPYDVLSNTSNFTSYAKESFWKKMQKKLSKVYKDLDTKWVKVMLSNNDTPFIRKLYKEFNIHIVKARRNINSNKNKRGLINEVVITNY